MRGELGSELVELRLCVVRGLLLLLPIGDCLVVGHFGFVVGSLFVGGRRLAKIVEGLLRVCKHLVGLVESVLKSFSLRFGVGLLLVKVVLLAFGVGFLLLKRSEICLGVFELLLQFVDLCLELGCGSVVGLRNLSLRACRCCLCLIDCGLGLDVGAGGLVASSLGLAEQGLRVGKELLGLVNGHRGDLARALDEALGLGGEACVDGHVLHGRGSGVVAACLQVGCDGSGRSKCGLGDHHAGDACGNEWPVCDAW